MTNPVDIYKNQLEYLKSNNLVIKNTFIDFNNNIILRKVKSLNDLNYNSDISISSYVKILKKNRRKKNKQTNETLINNIMIDFKSFLQDIIDNMMPDIIKWKEYIADEIKYSKISDNNKIKKLIINNKIIDNKITTFIQNTYNKYKLYIEKNIESFKINNGIFIDVNEELIFTYQSNKKIILSEYVYEIKFNNI